MKSMTIAAAFVALCLLSACEDPAPAGNGADNAVLGDCGKVKCRPDELPSR